LLNDCSRLGIGCFFTVYVYFVSNEQLFSFGHPSGRAAANGYEHCKPYEQQFGGMDVGQ
jgi:hypothetical protein